MPLLSSQDEFDRQVRTLLENGCLDAAGMSEQEFLRHVEPLRTMLADETVPSADPGAGSAPFAIVLKRELIEPERMMPLLVREGRPGITKLHPHVSSDFHAIDSVEIPDGPAYLLLDIDRGKETLNMAPLEALKVIEQAGRSPLTIEEGIAVVMHFPDFLRKNNCFSLAGSRSKESKCVPALWIAAQKHVNLGWCWEGNPHTWLGSASCGKRRGAA